MGGSDQWPERRRWLCRPIWGIIIQRGNFLWRRHVHHSGSALAGCTEADRKQLTLIDLRPDSYCSINWLLVSSLFPFFSFVNMLLLLPGNKWYRSIYLSISFHDLSIFFDLPVHNLTRYIVYVHIHKATRIPKIKKMCLSKNIFFSAQAIPPLSHTTAEGLELGYLIDL
jgi:hypothetical protein